MDSIVGRLLCLVPAAGFGFISGCVAGIPGVLTSREENHSFLAERAPLPHHVPKYPGGISFRFAMAHDVIHERSAKHGPGYYEERNRLTREKLAVLAPNDPARFPLDDDIAAGLDRLGQSDEAVAVMRDKLARQRAAGLEGGDLYTTYANLGTFLIHGSYRDAASGDAEARERFREGIGFIRKSVAVNPEAHFGREQWQAAIAEFVLVAMDEPILFRTFDCIGNRLDRGLKGILNSRPDETREMYGRASHPDFGNESVRNNLPAFFELGRRLDDPVLWQRVSPIRAQITKVGAEQGWRVYSVPSHKLPVPFDEPMLGIIGMWRQGGGANPHFALAIGETMLRVGQRYLAWTAFERAVRMAERFSPDPRLQHFLRDHCHKRQREIEETFLVDWPEADWRPVRPQPSEDEVANLRSKFEAELAYSERFQREYQQYEASNIAAGASITDEDFFDEFFEGHEPIASPIGSEEWIVWVPQEKSLAYEMRLPLPWGVFGAGLASMAMSLLVRWRSRRPFVQELKVRL